MLCTNLIANSSIAEHIMGICIYIMLYQIGDKIMTKNNGLLKLSLFFSNLSYPVFLVHHVLIVGFLRFFMPRNYNEEFLYIIVIAFTVILVAYFVQKVLGILIKRISLAKGIH